jgi:hypothetical protein
VESNLIELGESDDVLGVLLVQIDFLHVDVDFSILQILLLRSLVNLLLVNDHG